MENIKVKVKGDKLILEIDLSVKGTESSTGKSNIIAQNAASGFTKLEEYGTAEGYLLTMKVLKGNGFKRSAKKDEGDPDADAKKDKDGKPKSKKKKSK